MILTITAPSGAGKTTLALFLMTDRDLRFKLLRSVTTRPSRETDLKGEYQHVRQRVFERLADEGVFIWHTQVHENRYGTERAEIDRAFADKTTWHIMILVPGVLPTLRAHAREKGFASDLVSIYFSLPERILRERLIGRGESGDGLEKRIADCRGWAQHPAVTLCATIPHGQLITTEELAKSVMEHLKI